MTTNFLVVGLAGAAGAGKDTAAQILRDRFGFSVYAFAKPIKDAINAMFDWSPAMWDDRAWKEAVQPDIGKSPRQMAQTLGTEWGRDLVNRDLWLLLARRRFVAARHAGLPGIVLTDCRFTNEAQLVRELGGSMLQIVRPSAGAVAAHSSESGLPADLIDDVIVNDGTIADLGDRLAAALAPK